MTIRILLVDDDEDNSELLSRRLGSRGYEVLLASDGQQGLDVARAQLPDLILMDMTLPIVDGWEATCQLKAVPATSSIPVIALTAHAMSGDRERAMSVGCDDYDSKPIEFANLLRKIEALLTRISPHGA